MKQSPTPPKRRLTAFSICAAILALYAAISWAAVSRKNATADEPAHITSAWLAAQQGDYRFDPEQPALWKLIVGSTQSHDALKFDRQSPNWAGALSDPPRLLRWWLETLFRTPGNDPEAMVRRGRAVSLVIAVAVGALTALWAWELGGLPVCVIALALLCLDPTFLAHGPLVKNDVPLVLPFLGAAYAAYRISKRLTPLNALAFIAACAAAPLVKLNGVLVPLIVVVPLIVRALRRGDWTVIGRTLVNRGAKISVLLLLIAATIIGTWALAWASYRFRFAPTPGSSETLTTQYPLAMPPPDHMQDRGYWKARPAVQLMLWMEREQLLPQSLIYGALYQYTSGQTRNYFLFDQVSDSGWWYYFPVTILLKTPLTTIGLAVLAIVGWFVTRGARGSGGRTIGQFMFLPLALFMLLSIVITPNQGLRYLLPCYPLAYLLIGMGVSRLCSTRWSRIGAGAVMGLLAVESLAAFPNFIPYFNVAANGSRGGLHLLGDSNLDWGQDLAGLAQWQTTHTDRPLYLCYFGAADPEAFGLKCHYTDGSFPFDKPREEVMPNSYFAISATHLQGIYVPMEMRAYFQGIERGGKLVTVIGGSIYVYRVD